MKATIAKSSNDLWLFFCTCNLLTHLRHSDGVVNGLVVFLFCCWIPNPHIHILLVLKMYSSVMLYCKSNSFLQLFPKIVFKIIVCAMPCDPYNYLSFLENIGKVLFFCLAGPGLEAHPAPDLDLAQGPTPGEWGDMHSLPLRVYVWGWKILNSSYPNLNFNEKLDCAYSTTVAR